MDTEELFLNALEQVRDRIFTFTVKLSGDKFPDGWEKEIDFQITKENILFELSARLDMPEYMFEDFDLDRFDFDSTLRGVAFLEAFPDGKPEGEKYSFKWDGVQIRKYMESWEWFVDRLMDNNLSLHEYENFVNSL